MTIDECMAELDGVVDWIKDNPPEDFAPLEPDTVEFARQILKNLASSPIGAPTAIDAGGDGSIVLIWDDRKDKHFEVYIKGRSAPRLSCPARGNLVLMDISDLWKK